MWRDSLDSTARGAPGAGMTLCRETQLVNR